MRWARIGVWASRAVGVAALIGWLLAAPAALAESARKNYRQGLKAAEQGEWHDVARLMGQAIEAQARERERLAPLAQRPYIPHYYLGLAAFQLGDCVGAQAAWKESLRQQVISGIEAHESLLEKSDICRRGLDAQTQATSLLDQAAAISGSLEELDPGQSAGPPPTQEAASFNQRLKLAEEGLSRALSRLRAARITDPEAMESVRLEAAQALDGFVTLQIEVSHLQQAAIDRNRQPDRHTLDALIRTAHQRLDDTTHLQPYAPIVGRRRATLETTLKSAADSGTALSPGEIETLEQRLTTSLKGYEQAVIEPPRALYQVVETFLSGDYDETLKASQAISAHAPRTRGHLHLLRAASLFALDQSEETRDDPLNPVRLEIAKARQAAPSLRPSLRLFSPRFIELFDDNEKSVSPERP